MTRKRSFVNVFYSPTTEESAVEPRQSQKDFSLGVTAEEVRNCVELFIDESHRKEKALIESINEAEWEKARLVIMGNPTLKIVEDGLPLQEKLKKIL